MSPATTGFELVTKRTGKRVFLDEIDLVVPWTELVGLIEPFAPGAAGTKGGRPSFAVETMLRIHFLQQWFGLSDPAMEEALHDISLYCQFVRLDPGGMRLPDESTIFRFRHLPQEHNLSIQLMATINATLATKGLIYQSALQGLGQEHGTASHADCGEQSVDGAPTAHGSAGMSLPKMRATAAQWSERAANWSQYAQESAQTHFKLHRVSSCRSTLHATGVMQTFPRAQTGEFALEYVHAEVRRLGHRRTWPGGGESPRWPL